MRGSDLDTDDADVPCPSPPAGLEANPENRWQTLGRVCGGKFAADNCVVYLDVPARSRSLCFL